MSADWHPICGVSPPDWSPAWLLRLNDTLASSLRKAIRPDALGGAPIPVWQQSRKSLTDVFGHIDSPNHLLNVPDWNWGIRLTEPQVTKGWQHFLSPAAVGHDLAAKRVAVFYEAICIASKRQPTGISISDLSVEAEHSLQIGGRRKAIDLLFRWKEQSASEQNCAIVVELKFGHVLTTGQLPSYKKYVAQQFIKGDGARHKSGFFVLSPRTRRRDQNKLRRNTDWSVAYWPAFLRAFEKIYTARDLPYDNAFNMFRRAVWQMKDDF